MPTNIPVSRATPGDAVPAADVAKLKANPNVHVTAELGSRVHFLTMDQARDVSPFITDKAGRPLTSNPLKDVRVRRALSLAINRAALVERLAMGQGQAAAQMMPGLISGSVSEEVPLGTDPVAARKLLADAGWADGFAITIHTTADDRSPIAQAGWKVLKAAVAPSVCPGQRICRICMLDVLARASSSSVHRLARNAGESRRIATSVSARRSRPSAAWRFKNSSTS